MSATAITMRAYRIPDGEPLNTPIQCGYIKPPVNAYTVDFFAVMPPGTAQDTDFQIFIETEYTLSNPASGANWKKGPGGGAPGEPDRVPGHLVGADPGQINPATNEHWDFEQESSPGTGFSVQLEGNPLSAAWVRPRMIVTSGNPSGVLLSLVAVARDIDGVPLEFDLSTRGG